MFEVGKRTKFRFNTVINKYNYTELVDIARLAVSFGVSIVNFINFNPHHAWKQHLEEAYEIVADLRKVEPILIEAISLLEEKGVGVNVRYYPMCRMKEEYRRTICNDLHVLFDPYEWDYMLFPKSVGGYMMKGQEMSFETEEKDEPCLNCHLHNICGGINKYFNIATKGTMINPIKDFRGEWRDFYWYRKYNERTLIPK